MAAGTARRLFSIYRAHPRTTSSRESRRRGDDGEAALVAVGDDVRGLADGGGAPMRFPPRLEALFERETRAARDHRIVARGLLAVVLYDLFLFADAVMTPDVIGQAAIVRLGIFTPLALLFLWLTRRGLSPAVRDTLQAVVSLVAAAGFTYIFTASTHPNAGYYQGGVVLVLAVVNLVVQLRYRHALGLTTGIVAFYAALPFVEGRLPDPIEGTNLMLVATTAAVTLFGNYRLEAEQRLTFLLTLRERLRSAQLQSDNRRLGKLATLDTLTALANRRAFNMHLRRLVRRPRAGQISVLIVDIDHFKQYNDRYGHQQGDVCLRRVAAALARVPTRAGDLIARLGGEEFAVILPGTDREAALAMAERLREAVSALAIAHETSPVAPHVTISVGVATGDQVPTGSAGGGLLAAADDALYRAKKAGRNRVAC
jgi:diguanylate cyclase (GGDEF)-like protein